MNEKELIREILKKHGIESIKIVVQHVQDIIEYQIPEKEQSIGEMDKEEMKTAVQKINMLGSIVSRPVDEELLDALYEQTLVLWGDPPSSGDGKWVEWCLWHHKRRYELGNPMGEIFSSGDRIGTAKERIEAYIQDRTQLSKERLAASSDKYKSPDEVPDRLRDILFRPAPPE